MVPRGTACCGQAKVLEKMWAPSAVAYFCSYVDNSNADRAYGGDARRFCVYDHATVVWPMRKWPWNSGQYIIFLYRVVGLIHWNYGKLTMFTLRRYFPDELPFEVPTIFTVKFSIEGRSAWSYHCLLPMKIKGEKKNFTLDTNMFGNLMV